MKKLSNKILSISVIVLFLIGTYSSFGQENSKNPYDFAGKQHNEIINAFIKKSSTIKFSNSNEELKFLNNLINTYRVEGKRLTINEVNFILGDSKNDFRNVINKSSLTLEGKKIAQRLIDFMLKMSYSENMTYDSFYKYVVSLESDILKNLNISKQTKISLLKITSIARYSGFLWNNYYNIKNSSSKMNFESFMMKKRWWKWLLIGAADAVGGTYGGVSGAVGASGLANKLLE